MSNRYRPIVGPVPTMTPPPLAVDFGPAWEEPGRSINWLIDKLHRDGFLSTDPTGPTRPLVVHGERQVQP